MQTENKIKTKEERFGKYINPETIYLFIHNQSYPVEREFLSPIEVFDNFEKYTFREIHKLEIVNDHFHFEFVDTPNKKYDTYYDWAICLDTPENRKTINKWKKLRRSIKSLEKLASEIRAEITDFEKFDLWNK